MFAQLPQFQRTLSSHRGLPFVLLRLSMGVSLSLLHKIQLLRVSQLRVGLLGLGCLRILRLGLLWRLLLLCLIGRGNVGTLRLSLVALTTRGCSSSLGTLRSGGLLCLWLRLLLLALLLGLWRLLRLLRLLTLSLRLGLRLWLGLVLRRLVLCRR